MATTSLEITVDELKHLVSDRALTGETVLLNMGPQHPSTHGVLRLLLELDGERVVNCIPDIGYLHTGIEKNMEAKTFIQAGVMTDRMDYLNTMGNILVYVLAIEKLVELDVPGWITSTRWGTSWSTSWRSRSSSSWTCRRGRRWCG